MPGKTRLAGNGGDGDGTFSRAVALDDLDAILPFERREWLAAILTDDDVATLSTCAREGMGANSVRALASDLAYLESWSLAATGDVLPWPAPEALAITFIAHHVWDPARREIDPDHGMPEDVVDALRSRGLLRLSGPHAPSTVRRRLSSWAALTRRRSLPDIFSAPSVKNALRHAIGTAASPRQRKSRNPVTVDILNAMLAASSGDRLVDIRDRAVLLVAFAAGGRRRSEIADLRIDDLQDETPVRADPEDAGSPALACLSIRFGRAGVTSSAQYERILLLGRPVVELKRWLTAAGITQGAVFRRVDRWGNIRHRPLTPQSVNLIVKTRALAAGLDPSVFSAHGLRSGYLTEAASRGIPLSEAMRQSGHRSVRQAAEYYHGTDGKPGRAARLIV